MLSFASSFSSVRIAFQVHIKLPHFIFRPFGYRHTIASLNDKATNTSLHLNFQSGFGDVESTQIVGRPSTVLDVTNKARRYFICRSLGQCRLSVPKRQILRYQLRHGGQARAVRQKGWRFKILVHVEGQRNVGLGRARRQSEFRRIFNEIVTERTKRLNFTDLETIFIEAINWILL